MTININHHTTVTLTEEGAALYNQYRSETLERISANAGAELLQSWDKLHPLKIAGDTWSDSMWRIMKTLAPSFGAGMPNAIQNCEIEVKG